MGLTPEEEEIASQYRRMLRMGLPEGAVIQKMVIGAVPQNIQDAVLGGEETTGASTEDPPNSTSQLSASESTEVSEESIKFERSEKTMNAPQSQQSMNMTIGSMSYYEEIIEDDSIMEEEIVDDSNTYDEDFEEEIVDDSERPGSRMADEGSSEGDSDSADESEQSHTNATDEQGEPEDEPVEVQDQAPSEVAVSRGVHDNSAPIDVEEQRPVERPSRAYQIQTMKATEKAAPSPGSCWYWIVCLILLGLIGAGAGVGYWLTTTDGDKVSDLKPLTRTGAPTDSPIVTVSTKFDPVQGRCNLGALSNPSPIDQCNCDSNISVLADDIVERYLFNLETFIPLYFDEYNEEITSCSPRNQALVWLSSGNDEGRTMEERTAIFALATFYASLGGSQWNNNNGWLTYGDFRPCKWYGITCEEGYVTQLVVPGNNLVGTLPSELSLLERLQFLMVAQNKISGPMPVSLFSIESLGTVDVAYNVITGVIPPSVGDAPSLNSLNVESNRMSGRLTRNIGKVSNMGYLNLRFNEFLSELPAELFNLQRLDQLHIGGNQFTGVISESFSNLRSLSKLTIGPNLFTGTIPSSLSSLPRLRYLSIEGIPDLTGRIPAELGFQMNSIEELIISSTGVGGNIDTSFGRLPNLKSLNFSSNQLRSVIPAELGNLSNLVTLDLGYNFLDGQIPDAIGNLLSLEEMRMNNNLLQGGIPVSFGNLVNLNTMRLEANRLEDRVADDVCDLRQNSLDVFVVDCPIEIPGTSEIFGVVCQIPSCCTKCVSQS